MGEFFVRRPIFAMVISIIIIIAGLVAMASLPIAQYPDITPPEIKVEGTYDGANAVNVEQSVATPLEQKVNGVENMLYMKSTNAGNGQMTLSVAFEVGSDLDISNVLVQNRVSEGSAQLPEEVKRRGVKVKKALAFPLMLVTLRSPNGTFDADFLTNYMSINVLDEIARIQGVGQVTIFGGADYAMRIWIKPDQLSRLSLTVPDIVGAVQQQNVLTPAGKIGGPPAAAGTEFAYAVQTRGRLETPEQFGEVVVRSNPDGSQVLLRDVARIELGAETYNQIGAFDAKPAAVLAVYQLPDANGLQVAEHIRSAMQRMKERFPEDIEYVISLDTTKPVSAGIEEIVRTLFEATAIVTIVVFVFLQNFRATLIPTLAVPVALIGTFAVFPLLGFSINTFSLLGLVLAIGIVVDDAIVVVEGVSEKMERGVERRQATIETMKEVSGPVIATALSLIAVFVPVAAMSGITGRLYQQFAITIAISVSISAIVALTLSPALCSTLLQPHVHGKKGRLARFFGGFNRILDGVTEKYVGVTSRFTHRPLRALAVLGVLVVALVWLFRTVPGGFVPEEDQAYLMANLQLPDAASLERTHAAAAKVEAILGADSAIESFTTVTGYSFLSGASSTNNAFFFIQLKDWDERPEAGDQATQVVHRLNGKLAAVNEGIAIAFGPPAIPGLGTGSGFSIMLQDRVGNSPDYLAEQTDAFIQAAAKRPELAGLYTTYRATVPQIFLDVDTQKTMKLGVEPADVNQTLGSFLGGAYVNDFNRFGRLYKVYVQAETGYRKDLADASLFYVRNGAGDMVPMNTLLTDETTNGPEFTYRFNMFRAAEVTGRPAPGFSSGQALKALEEVAAQVLPSDMSYAWNAMSYQEKAAEGSGSIVFVMALVFVFLILAAQYESWSLPFGVLFGTPIAIFGAMFGLWIARFFSSSYENNVFAQIGLVMLIGLAAKNAILIVEFARAETARGKGPVEAALEAARRRFRPILMTSFAFILGVVPLILASGAGAEARKIMGMTAFSGMLVATLVGVVLVPGLYVVVERYLTAKKKPATPAESVSEEAKP
jgi:HAE1 family hydrophobic/amphiphilic exporter-1